jgi:hypothetical protein
MGRIGRIGSVALVALLVLGGAACLAYGALRHEREVLVEQEIELPPGLQAGPRALPWDPVPPPTTTTRVVGIGQTEPEIVRDITVGGLTRLESGELKRTYTGEAPSLCPS